MYHRFASCWLRQAPNISSAHSRDSCSLPPASNSRNVRSITSSGQRGHEPRVQQRFAEYVAQRPAQPVAQRRRRNPSCEMPNVALSPADTFYQMPDFASPVKIPDQFQMAGAYWPFFGRYELVDTANTGPQPRDKQSHDEIGRDHSDRGKTLFEASALFFGSLHYG